MANLSLGNADSGLSFDESQFLVRYHANLPLSKAKTQFRDEGNNQWKGFTRTDGSDVSALQQFLHNAGFMPKPEKVEGVFGYATQAAARLFQEYVRTVEKIDTTPDGIVGTGTKGHIQRWQDNGLKCEWANWSKDNPSPEYAQWLSLLGKAKDHFKANGSEILDLISQHRNKFGVCDTRIIDEWDVSNNTVHLIGLRQGEDAAVQSDFKGRFRRANDDLFVFLINGMVFKFWGSTDPNPELSRKSGNPFLIEGQHNYRFGWHKINLSVSEKAKGLQEGYKVYRALQPFNKGVLVYRVPNAGGLTAAEVAGGIDPKSNTTINIHWSGEGDYNQSAGCQVMAGRSYINHKGEVVSCSKYAASSYNEIGGLKGRGAYNMFVDLLLTYGPPGVDTMAYTLGRDETLRLADNPEWKDVNYVRDTVKRMMEVR
jgi:hypothetical protein